jgi:hypothetical protein
MKINRLVLPALLLLLGGCASTRSNTATFTDLPSVSRPTIAAASLINAPAFAPTISSSSISSRDDVLKEIEVRLKTSDTAAEWARYFAVQLNGEERLAFQRADDDLKEKRDALKRRLSAAHKGDATDWQTISEKLAADCEAYGAALVRFDETVMLPR